MLVGNGRLTRVLADEFANDVVWKEEGTSKKTPGNEIARKTYKE